MLTYRILIQLCEDNGRDHYAPNKGNLPRPFRPGWRDGPGVYGPMRHAVPVPEPATVVMSLRDPRDVLVSMYYAYCYSHGGPVKGGTGHRAEVANRGIDEFVIRMATATERPYEGNYGIGNFELAGNVRTRHDKLLDLAEARDATVLTYEQMVRDFDAWLGALASALRLDITKPIEVNFTPKGQHAHRRHVQPGDHRSKLTRATIAQLDEVFAPYFERLRSLGAPIPS